MITNYLSCLTIYLYIIYVCVIVLKYRLQNHETVVYKIKTFHHNLSA